MYSLAPSYSVSGEKCVVFPATPETKDVLNIAYSSQPPAALNFSTTLTELELMQQIQGVFFYTPLHLLYIQHMQTP
jgi:hypothetical protein